MLRHFDAEPSFHEHHFYHGTLIMLVKDLQVHGLSGFSNERSTALILPHNTFAGIVCVVD